MPNASSANAWPKITLAECAEEIAQRVDNPAESGFERFVGLEHIGTGDTVVRSWGSTDDVTSSMKVFKAGDVIVARRNVYLRRAAQAEFDGVCSGDGIVFRAKPEVCIPQLLPFLLNTANFWNYVTSQADGTMSKRITVKRLLSYEFSLPPVEEQRRIVSCLAAARSASDKMERVVCEARTLLSAAIDDQLRYYPVRTIGQLVDDGVLAAPQDGNHGEKHPKEADYSAEGVPFIMAADLREGSVDFAGCKKLREDHARSLRIGFAKNGDILLSHKGTVGSVARLQDIPSSFAMLTPQVTYYRSLKPEQLLQDWIYFAFQSTSFQSLLLQRGRQSTRSYIGITAQKELSIPYCDVEKQHQHVKVLLQIEAGLREAVGRVNAIRSLKDVLASVCVPA